MSEDTVETINSLSGENTQEAANRLKQIELSTKDRLIQKAARKALYLLSQRGISPGFLAKPVVKPKRGDTSPMRAYSSAFDGAGNRLLVLLFDDPDGGSPTIIQLLLNDLDGIGSFETVKAPRREVNERMARLLDQVDTGMAFVEIEPDYARYLIQQARQLNTTRGKRSPRGTLGWMPRIGEPEREYTAPILDKIDTKANEDAATSPDAPALFALSWFEAWYFAAEDTVPWLPQWEQSQAMEAEDPARESAQESIIDLAIPVLMTSQMRELYTIRLLETADILWRCQETEAAKLALRHATSLMSDADTSTIPFVREIVRRTLGAALELVRVYREQRAREQG